MNSPKPTDGRPRAFDFPGAARTVPPFGRLSRSATARNGVGDDRHHLRVVLQLPVRPRVTSILNSFSLRNAVTSPNGVVSHRFSVCDQIV